MLLRYGVYGLACVVGLACGDNLSSQFVGRDAGPEVIVDAQAPGIDATVATVCSGDRFPTNIGNPISCCQYGDKTWHIVGGGSNLGKLGQRSFAKACTQADGVTHNCSVGSSTGTACAFGPCGAKIDWSIGPFTPTYVFMASTGTCGWQAGPDMYDPEPYTNQPLFSSVIASCPYRDCLADGTPVVAGFAVSITADATAATGMVVSAPSGISLTGAGTAQWGYASGAAVTLTATPTGSHARAVLGGACAVTGDYGAAATCALTLDAARAVTVTYECEATFTCL